VFKFNATALLILLTLSTQACRSSKEQPLRLGVNFWASTEFIFMAQARGYFAEAGVPIELVEYSSLNDLRRGFEHGQVDAMACTLVEVMMARENTARRPQLVQIADFSNGADFIVAKPAIASVAALRGRDVGVEAGSMGILVLGRALEQAGMSLHDVNLIAKDQSNMERTYASGEVDAVVTYPPFSVGLRDGMNGHIIFDSTRIPGEVVDIIAVDAAQLNPKMTRGIQKVWSRILADVAQDREGSYGMMAKRERISLEEFEATMSGLKIVSVEEQRRLYQDGRLRATTANIAKFLHETGVLHAAADVDDVLRPLQELVSAHK